MPYHKTKHPWKKEINGSERKRMLGQRWKDKFPEKLLAYNRKRAGLPEATRPCPQLCECCGNLPGKKAMHLDHDHATGAFRGWLCSKCNTAIGMLGDTREGVQRALNYLTKASEPDKVRA